MTCQHCDRAHTGVGRGVSLQDIDAIAQVFEVALSFSQWNLLGQWTGCGNDVQ